MKDIKNNIGWQWLKKLFKIKAKERKQFIKNYCLGKAEFYTTTEEIMEVF